MTVMIKQRSLKDCYPCCAMMALGVTYEEFVAKVGTELMDKIHANGTFHEDKEAMFFAFGMEFGIHFEVVTRFYAGNFNDQAIRLARDLLWGRKAIITAKSLNREDGMHAIYWDGKELFDPSNLNTYKTIEDVEPAYLTIFS